MPDLKKDISFKSSKANGKVPTKTTMNLVQGAYANENWPRLILIAVLLIIFIFLLVQFGVSGRLATLNKLHSENADLAAQVEKLEEQSANYDSVMNEYHSYGLGITDETTENLVDRTELIDLATSAVANYGSIDSVTIVENDITIVVKTSSLKNVAAIRSALLQNKYVYSVEAKTADYSGTDTSDGVTSNDIIRSYNNISEDATDGSTYTNYSLVASINVKVSLDGTEPVDEETESTTDGEE